MHRHSISADPLGSWAFAERYHAAFPVYSDDIALAEHATIVIWNDDFTRQQLLRFRR